MSWLAARSQMFWVVVAVLAPVLYVGSFGPACWLEAQPLRDGGVDYGYHPSVVYFPLGALAFRNDLFMARWMRQWLMAGVPKDYAVLVPIGPRKIGGFSWPASAGGTAGGAGSADPSRSSDPP